MNTNEANNFGAELNNETNQVTVPATPATSEASMEPAAISSTDVTAALNAILSVDKFAASPQMSAFLKYVVEQTLLGNTRRIKAFTVGLEALGKSASFDPQTDPSVRVLAKRLRSSLDTYYLQHPETPIIIEMKPGSYVPKFLLRGEPGMQTAASATNISVPATSTLSAPIPTATNVASNHPTHLSINQPTRPGDEGARTATDATSTSNTTTETTETAETAETRNSGLQRLWKAYKSTPKVAMLVATLGLSGWLGVASMAPSLNAQASYSDNPTAEMRLGSSSASEQQPLRERPTSLTLYTEGESKTQIDGLKHPITNSLLQRFSESGQLTVASKELPVNIAGYWPEEYRMIVNAHPVNERVHLNVQIVNPDTGYIAQTESVVLDQTHTENELSNNSDNLLNELTAAFTHTDSPLLIDFRSNQSTVN